MGTKQQNLDEVARGIHSRLRTMTSNNEQGSGMSADDVAELLMNYLEAAHGICGVCSDNGTWYQGCKVCGKLRK